MAVPMANGPPFATLNHVAADLGIPNESEPLRVGISPAKLSNLGEFDTSSSRFVPRACTYKSAPCKRGSVNVRFAPKATELLRCRKTSLCANSGLLERSKTVCEGPSPEKPMHNAQGRPGKCCGGGGHLSTGNPPPKIDEAVFVGYRLNSGC